MIKIRTIIFVLLAYSVWCGAEEKTLKITNKLKWNAIIVEEAGSWINAASNQGASIKIMPGHSAEIEMDTTQTQWQYQYKISVKQLMGSTLTPICTWQHADTIAPLRVLVTDISGITHPNGMAKYQCGSFWLPNFLDVVEWPQDLVL